MTRFPPRTDRSTRGRSHLLERYIARSLLWPTLQLAGVLLAIMLLERGLRLLQEISALGIPGRYLGPLLIRLVPYYAQQALPFGFVVAVILVLSRMGRNREWEAMASAGISPSRIARIMALTACVVAAATLVISGFIEPLGRHGYRRLHAVAVNEARLVAIRPGAIYDRIPGVMLTASGNRHGHLEGVFVRLENGPQGPLLVSAHSAAIRVAQDPPTLQFVLERGEMLIGGVRAVQFDRITLNHPMMLEQTRWKRGRDVRELTLLELIDLPPGDPAGQRRQLAELYGKVARAMGLLALPWIALPLLAGSRGERRWMAVATIAFLVVAYYHSVNLSRNLGASGEIALTRMAGVTALLPVLAGALVWRLGSGVRQHAPVTLPFTLPRLRFGAGPRWRHRWPSLPRGMPDLLTGYLVGKLAAMTLAVLAGLVLILQVIDLLERGETLVAAGEGLAGFLRYAWLRLPATVFQAGPLAMLGGGLLAFALLRSSNELVAIHGQGISAAGVLLRVSIVPICFGLLLVGVSEVWSPRAQVAYTAWWGKLDPATSAPTGQSRRWFRIGPDLVEVGAAEKSSTVLRDVRIYQVAADRQKLREWVHADEARWNGAGWTLHRAERWNPAGGPALQVEQSSSWQTKLKPAPLARFLAAPVPLTGRDAWLAARDSVPIDRADTVYDTRLYMTVSLAIVPMLMLFLATALVVVPRKEVVLGQCLFQAATAGLAYLVLDGWLQVLGQSGSVPPPLAVAAAPLLFGTFALELILNSETNI